MKLNHVTYLERCAERRAAIYAHLLGSGSLTATAAHFKITKQRVQQIKERVEADGKDHAGGSDAPPPARAGGDG